MLAWLSAWGADLHIAQQMPLPLTISCSSKFRLVLTFLVLPFWYLLTRVDPDIFQTSSKMVVCVCIALPIYKGKGDPIECGSYRGIKLLEHAMKVVEGSLNTEFGSRLIQIIYSLDL